ncbi:flippase [Pusillimonas noertemannii]|uniref:O-antigen/teichoic acid export membrane protein n=1 Tax=Pusillimonas noertemannii TaxID=305977 RepID=A0A2U1CPW7_9BURK|nr:flippase [Pusillimonas noertemannii]NYT67183.1 flippase [Pusillimonas noertemannii]PVY67861.1 O-antigen/teichoic acid export membrane protein [Pusillimonas noertemannii]TFL12617.1 flippase [Pusillimonas noertemannii]
MSLSRNTIWNLTGAGLPLLVGAATIPYMTSKLGVERFGILTLLWAVIGYFSLFDLGMGRALTQQVAQSLIGGNKEEVPGIIKLGVLLTLFTGLAGSVLLLVTAYPLAYTVLNVSVEFQRETFNSLLIAAAGIPLATLSSSFRGALEAYERFFSSNLAKIFLGVSIFLFPALGIFVFGPNLVGVTVLLISARLLSCVIYLLLALRLPSGNFFFTRTNREMLKRLFSFGTWMTVSNLISPILVNIDRFIISFLLGAGVVAYYTLPFEFLARLLILPAAIGSALLPRLAKHHLNDSATAKRTYHQGLIVTAALMGTICVAASLVSYPLMEYFISTEFADKSWRIAAILAAGVFINGIAYIPFTALHSRGLARPTAILHVAELLIYVPLLYYSIKTIGLEGAAIGWALRALIDCLGLFYLHSRRK